MTPLEVSLLVIVAGLSGALWREVAEWMMQ